MERRIYTALVGSALLGLAADAGVEPKHPSRRAAKAKDVLGKGGRVARLTSTERLKT
jgi:hypothetical protein